MKSLNKSAIAVFVFGAVFATTANAATVQVVAPNPVVGTSNATQDLYNGQSLLNADAINLSDIEIKAARAQADNANDKATQNTADIQQLTGNTNAQFNAVNNYIDSVNQQQAAVNNAQQNELNDHDNRITTLENAPKPKDGVDGAKGDTGAQGVAGLAGSNGVNGKDGSNGKDGITTTITKVEVDQATQKAVAGLQQQQAKQNEAFKSLKSTVDDNHKQANAGISGAMAMAGLPQVQTNQRVMFSAGGATYNGENALAVGGSVNFNSHVVGKVSFSTDTASNMGASVGVGVGF
ncbi:YadA-like family protein [Enterobacter sp. LM3]|uniref:YadA C-terminal domain-containing protein n=1 Tax=Enterobacter sp. LM3 TaxID=3384450 RepID=UPI0015DD2D2B|nr:hypothetical protein WP5S18E01_27920 [Enterobacter cloacae]